MSGEFYLNILINRFSKMADFFQVLYRVQTYWILLVKYFFKLMVDFKVCFVLKCFFCDFELVIWNCGLLSWGCFGFDGRSLKLYNASRDDCLALHR